MAVAGPWILSTVSGWFSGKTVKLMLVTSAYTQDVDSDTVPTAQEVSGTGYTAGGVTVTGLTVTYDSTLNVVKVTCDDVSFGTVNLPDVAGAVLYSTTHMIAADLWSSVEVSSRPFTYRPGSDGLVVAGIETGV